MARTLSITDGTNTVSLIDTSGYYQPADAINLRRGDLTPSMNIIWNSSTFADGRSPVLSSANNVQERLPLTLTGTSHDDISSQLQTLIRLLRKSENYHTKNWQQTPVYLIAQTKNETNTRYALVYSGEIDGKTSLYDYTFEEGNLLFDLIINIEREPYWRSHAPHSMPTAITLSADSAPGTGTQQVIANYRGGVTIGKIYNYDDSATAFSSDFSASNSFTYFEVSGSTPAVDDCVYFGASDPFFTFVMNIGTAASTTGVSTLLEYWDGAAWATSDALTNTFVDSDFETGMIVIEHSRILANDWAKNTVNTQNLYWLRARITAVTSWTTSPIQSGQVVYICDDDYIQLADTQIDGDVPAKLQIQAHHWGGMSIGYLVLGTKSRGLTNFTSRLNSGDDSINPGDWTISYGDDTATESNPLGPDGYMAKCDFTSDQTMDDRITWTNTVASEVKDWEGEYHVYARLMQENGTGGDISVKLRILYDQYRQDGDVVIFDDWEQASMPFAISLGQFTIMSSELRGSETATTDLEFELHAKSDNGTTPDLFVLDLIFIPIDEWAAVVATDLLADADDDSIIVLDNGLERDGALVKGRINNDIIAGCELRGVLPILEPSSQTRLYTFSYTRGSPYAMSGNHVAISIYPHEQWALLRGAD